MPHIIIEYSKNVEEKVELDGLIESIHQTAIATGIFPIGGLRVRAARRDHYKLADGHPDNGFVHVELKIGPGRKKEEKIAALKRIFSCAEAYLEPIQSNGPFALSAELNEFNDDLRINKNNMHQYVEERANA